jgi:4'-phosphopantetheinyl transferase
MDETTLGMDEVHVWYQPSDSATAALSEDAVLSAEERTGRDQLHFLADRRDFALGHDLLRRSLSRYTAVLPHEWQFVKGLNGKPSVRGGALSFNLSHTRGLVACSIARFMAVGIDVERVDRIIDIETIARHVFSASEAATLVSARTNARTRFIELWTLKEAFVKAVGVGLTLPLDSFSFDLDEDEQYVGFVSPPGFDASEWQFVLYAPRPDARLAVAAHAAAKEPIRWQAHKVQPSGLTGLDCIRTSRR